MPTAVLKFGGEVVADAPRLAGVLADVRTLTGEGWRFLLLHGGGPQATALQERLGMTPNKVGGRRVTDAPTLEVMKQVLAGQVSVDVVAAAQRAGLRAVGLTGVSDGLISARRRPPIVVSGGGPEPVDYGLVGAIEEVRAELLSHLWAGGFTPVLSSLSLAVDTEDPHTRGVYNINADTVASKVAAVLGVDHLFLMTGVPGVLGDKDDPATRIPRLTPAAAQTAIRDEIIVGGMIPKVEEAFSRLAEGIGAVHILGAGGGDLTAEARAPGSAGTVLVPR